VFYVITRPPPGGGLFSNVWEVLCHISRAREKGWIPVVDMERYLTFYNEASPIHGTSNAWEYYFRQPSGYSLADVYDSANVVMSGERPQMPNWEFVDFGGDLRVLSKFIGDNVALIPEVQEYVANARSAIFSENWRVLGVSSRGSDYVALEPSGHSRQPELSHLLAVTHEMVKRWRPDRIFVTTEEQHVVDAFVGEFPGMVLTTDRFFVRKYDGKSLFPTIPSNGNNGRYLLGLEYLTDIYILSKCEYLLGALTCGSKFALALNGNEYRDKCIIDVGCYE
jgi:hypothetical protein